MTDYQALVREFHEASGQQVRSGPPSIPASHVLYLRRRLILEESDEAMDALDRGTLQAMAHELADLLYVVFGTAEALGVDLGPVYEEVHAANMRKLVDGKPLVGAGGKILKPPGWTPADVASVLRKQGWRDE